MSTCLPSTQQDDREDTSQDVRGGSSQDDQCNVMFHKAELPLLLMVSTIANLVATVTLARLLKRLKSKNLLLLTLLAVNDLFSSVVLLISIFINTMTCDLFRHNIVCNLLGWLGISSFGLSIYVIGIINLERMIMVAFPICHHYHVTVNKIWISLVIGEGITLILGGLPLVNVGAPYTYYKDNHFCGFDWSPWKQDNSNHAVLVLFNALYMLSVILFIAFCNMTVLVSLRKRENRFAGQSSRSHVVAEKFSLLTKVVGAFNCVCNLPFFIKLVVDYVNHDTSLQGVEDSVTSILLFCMPIINPFLYLLFNKLYRETIVQVGRKIFSCPRLCKTRVQPEGSVDVPMESSNVTTVSSATRETSATRESSNLHSNTASETCDTESNRLTIPSTSQAIQIQVTVHV